MYEPFQFNETFMMICVSLLLWGLAFTFSAITVFWVLETLVIGRSYDSPSPEYGGDDIQVRILTIDAEQVVQETVDSLPGSLSDAHVIAEEPMTIEGARVHVVPDSFECDAVRKGRALEWARRHVRCETEFVLYLDEDSLVSEFNGLPDSDIVQIRERPRRTGSYLTYLAEIFRVGVQLEQRAFGKLSIPLFAWGGGIAVRKTVEDEVTWNRETLVEDTAFVWRAAMWTNASYALSDAVFTNQAPPSFREILEQRRRWAAGNHQEAVVLPRPYRYVTRVRNVVWGLSPFAPFAAVPVMLFGVPVVHGDVLNPISHALTVCMILWFVLGLRSYDFPPRETMVGLALIPLVALIHSLGTVFGITHPPDDFRVTKKVHSSTDRRDNAHGSQSAD